MYSSPDVFVVNIDNISRVSEKREGEKCKVVKIVKWLCTCKCFKETVCFKSNDYQLLQYLQQLGEIQVSLLK